MTSSGDDITGDRGHGRVEQHWHGFARRLDRAHAEVVVMWIDGALRAQHDAAGSAGSSDALRSWFDPLARGERLRAAIARLEPLPPQPGVLDLPFVVPAGSDRYLVTFEGRELHHLLDRACDSTSASTVRLLRTATSAADVRAQAWYRSLAMSRLSSVLDLQSGAAAPMLPQAIGLMLLLLINGNIGAERGLRRPATDDDLRVVAEAFADIVSAFADTLVPPTRQRRASAYSLYSGYAISEARRRLGADLLKAPVALAAGSRKRVIARAAAELRRRDLPWSTIEKALGRLAQRYEERRPRLAAYGLAQAGPRAADDVRRELAAAATWPDETDARV